PGDGVSGAWWWSSGADRPRGALPGRVAPSAGCAGPWPHGRPGVRGRDVRPPLCTGNGTPLRTELLTVNGFPRGAWTQAVGEKGYARTTVADVRHAPVRGLADGASAVEP